MTVAVTEQEVSDRFRAHLVRLTEHGRCVWRPEVRLQAWAHAAHGKMATLRADYVLTLDGGPLLAVDVKRPPDSGSDIGRAHEQVRQYAGAVVAVATYDRVVPAWVGQPLFAAFLLYDSRHLSEARSIGCPSIADHIAAAARLFGPGNVGFVRYQPHCGLRLELGGDRWWSERDGYRGNAFARGIRVGSQRFPAPEGTP